MDPLAMLELHQFRHSAFCLKVRMVLQAKGLSFRTVEVTPGIGQVAVFRLSGQRQVPVLVDAGVGTASDATIAMELGCDGVLMNTAIAQAKGPIRMANAMRLAIESGREAYLAGRMPKKLYASASSPIDGTFF